MSTLAKRDASPSWLLIRKLKTPRSIRSKNSLKCCFKGCVCRKITTVRGQKKSPFDLQKYRELFWSQSYFSVKFADMFCYHSSDIHVKCCLFFIMCFPPRLMAESSCETHFNCSAQAVKL